MSIETYQLLHRLRRGLRELRHPYLSCRPRLLRAGRALDPALLGVLQQRRPHGPTSVRERPALGEGRLRGLGRLYALWPVAAHNAFHPKIILLCGKQRGRLIIGSGNLTVPGLSSNREVFSENNHDLEAPDEHLFRQVWRFVRSITADAGGAIRRHLQQVEEASPWLLGDFDPSGWPRLLVARPGQAALAKQIEQALAGRAVRRLIVVAPFFDKALAGLEALRNALSPKQVCLVVQPKKVSLPGNALAGGPVKVYQFSPASGQRSANAYLHAKLYVFETADEDYCLWGSPNCSAAALSPPGGAGNFEVALLASGPKRYFTDRLGLGPSLADSARIADPTKLALRELGDDKDPAGRLQLTSAEYSGGELEARLAPQKEAPVYPTGMVRLKSDGRLLSEITVRQTGEGTYRGEWTPGTMAQTVIARITLGSGASKVESTPAAVHFHTLLASESRTRHTGKIRKLLAAMEAGSEAWAQGLEHVCEIIFQLETLEESKAKKSGKMKRKGEAPIEDSEEGDEVGYEHFLADPASQSSETPRPGTQSSFLLDLVQGLNKRLLGGDHSDELSDEKAARDYSWRYQEEAEQGSAEDGGVPNWGQENEPQVNLVGQRRLRLVYLRLMEGLSRRAQVLRDQQQANWREELLKVQAVVTLVLQATTPAGEGVGPTGMPIQHEDVAEKLLPTLAILLARSPKGQHTEDLSEAPPVLWAGSALCDPDSKDGGCVIAIFLSTIVAHTRQQTPEPKTVRRESGAAGYTKLVAARSFSCLSKLGVLPDLDSFQRSAQHFGVSSPWISSAGLAGRGRIS